MPVRVKKTRHCEPLAVLIFLRDADGNKVEAVCYYYARLGRFGGVPYRELQRNLGEGDLAALRNVKLMIIEENESLIGRSNYIDEMLRIVGR